MHKPLKYVKIWHKDEFMTHFKKYDLKAEIWFFMTYQIWCVASKAHETSIFQRRISMHMFNKNM